MALEEWPILWGEGVKSSKRSLPPAPPPAAAIAFHTGSRSSSSTTSHNHSLRTLKISPQKSCSSQTIALPLFSKLGSNAFLPTASLALNSIWALATEDSWLAPEQRNITGMFVDSVAGRGTYRKWWCQKLPWNAVWYPSLPWLWSLSFLL